MPDFFKRASFIKNESLKARLFSDALERNGNKGRGKGVRNAVVRSMEFLRIRDMARRVQDDEAHADELARALTDRLKTPHGEMTLRGIQALMLIEAADHDGLFSSTPVGGGKSVAAPLFPATMKSDRTVLLLPPNIKTQMEQAVMPMVWQNFRKPRTQIVTITYNQLSSAQGVDLLHTLKPDLIVADEVHMLKAPKAARTRRFLNFFKENPQCRFVAMSGTITSKSLRDFHHLMLLTHKLDSPLPRGWPELEDWALAVDPEVKAATEEDGERTVKRRLKPGALLELCRPGENAAEGLGRRIAETHGVISSREGAFGGSLYVNIHKLDMPREVLALTDRLEHEWETPDDVLTDAAKVAAKAREISCGFYYKWVWPNGEPDLEWLDARMAWNRYVREVVKRGIIGLDTELLVRNNTQAVLEGRSSMIPRALRDMGVQALAEWTVQRVKDDPPVQPVWVSDFMVKRAKQWADEHPRGIIWYEHQAIGDALAAEGIQTFGAGPTATKTLLQLAGGSSDAGPIACSIRAHGTGKNLQHRWQDNLVLVPMSNAAMWEQMIGRTHRPGQQADEVNIDVFYSLHERCEEWMHRAWTQARYIKSVSGAPQKLLLATFVGLSVDELRQLKLEESSSDEDMLSSEDFI
jgi:hypothetical protein